eukprot:gene9698-13055_t
MFQATYLLLTSFIFSSIGLNTDKLCLSYTKNISTFDSFIRDSIVERKIAQENNDKTVGLITFAAKGSGLHYSDDEGVDEYLFLQIALIAAYANHNNYLYHPITWVDVDSDQMINDIRWTKVRLLKEAMLGWASKCQSVVWIDADAVVLDFNFKFEDLMTQQSGSVEIDLIASADIRMGFINTGVMIFRNSAWSVDFLTEWWINSDKNKLCDQEAFDLLYLKRMEEGDESHILVLPMDAINSHPPAMIHHKSHNPILHLMGESSKMRKKVFSHALQSFCKGSLALTGDHFIAPELGINNTFLLLSALEVYQNETSLQFSIVQMNDSSIEDYEALGRSVHHLCDALLFISNNINIHNENENVFFKNNFISDVLKIMPWMKSDAFNKSLSDDFDMNDMYFFNRASIRELLVGRIRMLRNDVWYLAVRKVRNLKKQLNEIILLINRHEVNDSSDSNKFMTSLLSEKRNLSYQIIMMQKKCAEVGNDLFWVEEKYSNKLFVAESVLLIINELLDRVADESRLIPLHMRALMLQNLGLLEYEQFKHSDSLVEHDNNNDNGGLQKAEKFLKQSVETFEEVLHLSESNNRESSLAMEYVYSLQLLSGVLCTIHQQSPHRAGDVDAMAMWNRTILIARTSAAHVKVGIHYENLAVVLYNSAICVSDLMKTSRDALLRNYGLSLVNESMDIRSTVIKCDNYKHDLIINKQNDDNLERCMGDNMLRSLEELAHFFSVYENNDQSGQSGASKANRNEGGNDDNIDYNGIIKAVHKNSGYTRVVGIERVGNNHMNGNNMMLGESLNDKIQQDDTITIVNDAGAVGAGVASDDSVDFEWEWEECSEEDVKNGQCEEYIIYEQVMPGLEDTRDSKHIDDKSHINPIGSIESFESIIEVEEDADLLAIFNEVDYPDEEERLELMETRRRYAQQLRQNINIINNKHNSDRTSHHFIHHMTTNQQQQQEQQQEPQSVERNRPRPRPWTDSESFTLTPTSTSHSSTDINHLMDNMDNTAKYFHEHEVPSSQSIESQPNERVPVHPGIPGLKEIELILQQLQVELMAIKRENYEMRLDKENKEIIVNNKIKMIEFINEQQTEEIKNLRKKIDYLQVLQGQGPA